MYKIVMTSVVLVILSVGAASAERVVYTKCSPHTYANGKTYMECSTRVRNTQSVQPTPPSIQNSRPFYIKSR